jgi:predicted MFS family arabinose efflux permease
MGSLENVSTVILALSCTLVYIPTSYTERTKDSLSSTGRNFQDKRIHVCKRTCLSFIITNLSIVSHNVVYIYVTSFHRSEYRCSVPSFH